MRELKLFMNPFYKFSWQQVSLGQLIKQASVECGQHGLRMTRKAYLFECGGQGRELHHLIFELNGTVDVANDTTIGK